MIRFIGDIHGDYNAYRRILTSGDVESSVQVGDFGIGFRKYPTDLPEGYHGFIRGNHDNPEACKSEPAWIKDGTLLVDDRHGQGIPTFFCGGASSIDRAHRTPGVNWWADEQLSEEELSLVKDWYVGFRPTIMVTHDCPDFMAEYILDKVIKLPKPYRVKDDSRTRRAFDRMFAEYQPKLWIFGHWHISLDIMVNATRFICLDINEYIDVDGIDIVKRNGAYV